MYRNNIKVKNGEIACQKVCKQNVGMGLWQYVDLCFHALSLRCLHIFWYGIPTYFYIYDVIYFLVSNKLSACNIIL